MGPRCPPWLCAFLGARIIDRLTVGMFDPKQVQWRLHPPTTAGYCQTSQMKNLIATICLTIALLLGSARVSWSQDYHKGYAAAQSGNFATALREWTPLAKQGNVNAQYNRKRMVNPPCRRSIMGDNVH